MRDMININKKKGSKNSNKISKGWNKHADKKKQTNRIAKYLKMSKDWELYDDMWGATPQRRT